MIENFNLNLYLKIIFVTGILIIIEDRYGLYAHYSSKYSYTIYTYLIHFILFAISYFSIILVLVSDKKSKISLTSDFWIKSIFGLIILSIYIAFYCNSCLGTDVPAAVKIYRFYIYDNMYGVLTCLIPIFIIFLIFDKKNTSGFYGMNLKNFNVKVNLPLILVVLIIAFIASFMKEVTEYYPIVNRTYYKVYAEYSGISQINAFSYFQFAYMFDFVMIELFFRGFMIFGFVKYLGKNVILPIACLYAVIHFGKPMPEIVSSFFGAYILGIITLQVNNIRTGIYLHCILAFSMEIFTMFMPWAK